MTKLTDRRSLAVASGVGLALLLTGCGSSPSAGGDVTARTGGHAASGSSASSPSDAGSPSTSAGPTDGQTNGTGGQSGGQSGGQTSGPAQCTAGQLRATLHPGNSAAGSTYVTLVLTNTGSQPCATGGFGGVSYVGHGDGTQIGAPAKRQQQGQATSFVLQPGAMAAATLQETSADNYPRARCRPTPADGLRIYPPNSTRSLFVKQQGAVGCANGKVQLLFVQPYHPEQ